MRFARHGEPGDDRPLVSDADGLWRDLGTNDARCRLPHGRLVGRGRRHGGRATSACRLDGRLLRIDAHHQLWDIAVRDQPWIAALPLFGASAAHTYGVTR